MEYNYKELFAEIYEYRWVPSELGALFGLRLFNPYDTEMVEDIDSLVSLIIEFDLYDELKQECNNEDLFFEYWQMNFSEVMTKNEFIDRLFEDYKKGLSNLRFTNKVRIDVLDEN